MVATCYEMMAIHAMRLYDIASYSFEKKYDILGRRFPFRFSIGTALGQRKALI